MKGKLYNKLNEYSEKEVIPFHMPGHKRNINFMEFENPYKIDITEIEGFDNLHNPKGILKEIMDDAAKIFKAEETFFLINGSTSGILSAISAVVPRGEKVLVARNCHKSVYNAVFLRGLEPVYIYPEKIDKMEISGSVNPENLKEILNQNKDIKAVVITSPTYEGVVSDIAELAKISHLKGIPIIVDEAHGAHFLLSNKFPKPAIECGADIVIQSIHKTLPSLTQTAILHINSKLVDKEKIKRFLSIYQTSSPSYVLMSSIDNCISSIKTQKNNIKNHIIKLEKLREKIIKMENISLVCKEKDEKNIFDYDISKIVVSVKGTDFNGKKLYKELVEKYNIQVEMASTDYIVAMTSHLDEDSWYERFIFALKNIDEIIKKHDKINIIENTIKAEVVYSIEEAYEHEKTRVEINNSVDEIAGEYVFAYPPGIPIVVPGEKITKKLIETIKNLTINEIELEGLSDKENKTILVLKNQLME